jgi:cytochrome c553
MTWQLTNANGVGVVRERYWLSFQPGEIRVCSSCHGVNTQDQSKAEIATNSPQALLQLLQAWKAGQQPVARDKFVYLPSLIR